jgi:DNA-binding CsgD family transcriptional regulator
MNSTHAFRLALYEALNGARGQSEPIERARAATKILGILAHGDQEAGAIRRGAVNDLRSGGMSYGQIARQLDIARGTVQVHAEYDQRHGVDPGLVFAFRDETGNWHPDEPDKILPGGYAVGDYLKLKLPADRPSQFAGQELMCAYEDTASGRLSDDSPGYVYAMKHGTNMKVRRSTKAFHDALWEQPPD